MVDKLLESDRSTLDEHDQKREHVIAYGHTEKPCSGNIRSMVQFPLGAAIAGHLILICLHQRRVTGIAKELKRIHMEAVQNSINSVTMVAVVVAPIAFIALFNLPRQCLINDGAEAGRDDIVSNAVAFRASCVLNATAMFVSLAVVVVQITMVVSGARARKQLVYVVNKLIWAARICTCGELLSICFCCCCT